MFAGRTNFPEAFSANVDSCDRAVLTEPPRSAVRTVSHDQVHPAIMLEIGKECRCGRFTFAVRQTTLDHPRHWLAVVIEQQEREGDLINASPILREIGCNQEVLTTVPVEVCLPDVREPN